MKNGNAIQNANATKADGNGMALIKQAVSFSCPFPPPTILSQYEAIYPGTIKRIMDIAERQQNASIELDKAESKRQDAIVSNVGLDVRNEEMLIKINGRNIALAIVMAFLLGFACIIGACLCAKYNQPWLGGCIGCGGIAAIVTAFICGAHMRRNEVTNKTYDKKKK